MSNVSLNDTIEVQYLGNTEDLLKEYEDRGHLLHSGKIYLHVDGDAFYIHQCTVATISGEEFPVWTCIGYYDAREEYLRSKFANMSLEQKVDFLIEQYIESSI